jgi:NADH:quinone reductase (non-electrogenic)
VGQVIGLIHDIPTCEELCKRIEQVAEATLSDVQSMIVPASKM